MMDSGQQEYIAAMHAHYEREFAEHRRADPLSVAAAVHEVVDAEIAREAASDAANFSRVSCRAGCAHCCHQNVTITKGEAALLLEYAQERGLSVDWKKIKRQASHAGVANWSRQPPQDMRCAFLGPDDRCGVYEHRPTACRKHFVVSPPADCDIVANPGTQVMQWAPPTVEVIASAAFAVYGSASMPVMLQRARKKE